MKYLAIISLFLFPGVIQAQSWDKTVNDDYQSVIHAVLPVGNGEYLAGGHLITMWTPLFYRYSHSNGIASRENVGNINFPVNEIVENKGVRYVIGSEGCYDVGFPNTYIAKMDLSGNFIWQKTSAGTDEDNLNQAVLDDSLNLYLQFDKQIWKLDSSGVILWKIGEQTSNQSTTNIATHPEGLIYSVLKSNSLSKRYAINKLNRAGQLMDSAMFPFLPSGLHRLNDSLYVFTGGTKVYLMNDELIVTDSADMQAMDMLADRFVSNDTAIFFVATDENDYLVYAGYLGYDLSLKKRTSLPGFLEVYDIALGDNELVIAGGMETEAGDAHVSHGFIKGIPLTFPDQTAIYDIAVTDVKNSKRQYVSSQTYTAVKLESKVTVKNMDNVAIDSLWLQMPDPINMFCNRAPDVQKIYTGLQLQPGDSTELTYYSETYLAPPPVVGDSVKFTYTIMASRPNSRVESDLDNNYKVKRVAEIFTGIEKTAQGMGLLVYPNPASTSIEVDFETSHTGKIQLLNMLGQAIMEQRIQNEKTIQLDISSLPSGVYMIKADTGAGVMTKKILKR